MSITYEKHKLYPKSILIRKFKGKVTGEDIIASWKYLIENRLIDAEAKGVINNLLDCELVMDLKSFENLLAYLKKQDLIKKIKQAVVLNSPEMIIFPILAESNESGLKIKPFSTMRAADKWILTNS